MTPCGEEGVNEGCIRSDRPVTLDLIQQFYEFDGCRDCTLYGKCPGPNFKYDTYKGFLQCTAIVPFDRLTYAMDWKLHTLDEAIRKHQDALTKAQNERRKLAEKLTATQKAKKEQADAFEARRVAQWEKKQKAKQQ